MGGGSLEMPAMEHEKRVWLRWLYPLRVKMGVVCLAKKEPMLKHGGRRREQERGDVYVITRLSVKWTGARKYLL